MRSCWPVVLSSRYPHARAPTHPLAQLSRSIVAARNYEAVQLHAATQGTGQVAYAIPAGDGFVTDAPTIASFAGKKQCTTRYCTTGALQLCAGTGVRYPCA